jgi:hypothetical protein
MEFTNYDTVRDLLRYSYVTHLIGHTNSKGEPAEWVIKSESDGHIISSHKSKEDAKKHLQDIEIHK